MRLFAAAAIVAATTLAPIAAAADPTPGTYLAGTMAQTIDTKTAYVGEQVVLDNVSSNNGTVSRGRLYGTVTSVTKPGQGRPAQVRMYFTRLVMPSGATYAVSGVVTGTTTQTKSNAAKEAVGALGGMLVGNMIGKTIFHTNAGGFLGAVGGFLIAKNNKQNVTLPAGSAVQVRLSTVRRQAHY